MVVAVEGLDLLDRRLLRVQDLQQAEVFLVDQSSRQELVCEELVPAVPIITAWSLEADDRLRVALAGLGECQHLEPFVMRAESTGKKRDRVGFLLEHQLSREEVFEGDQFRVIRNDGISSLLER